MGSIEIYDYQRQQWVPYIPTPEDTERYYQKVLARLERKHTPAALATTLRHTEEKLRETNRKLEEAEAQLKKHTPRVDQVTPIAQAIEIAESQVKRERKNGRGRKKSGTYSSIPSRLKRISYQ